MLLSMWEEEMSRCRLRGHDNDNDILEKFIGVTSTR